MSAAPIPIMRKTARETLLQEIKELQQKHEAITAALQQKLKALSALESAEIKESGISGRSLPYSGMRTWKAIRQYLEEQGQLRTLKQVADAMIAGGAMYGKREWRSERNVKTAVSMAQDLELVEGDRVGLSEWFGKGGKYSNLKPEKKK